MGNDTRTMYKMYNKVHFENSSLKWAAIHGNKF